MRSAGLKRAGSGFLVATVAAGLFCVTGCDNDQNEADKQTRSDLTEAQQKTNQGEAAAANATLVRAAQNAAASSAGLRASAKASLAQSEFQAGQETVGKIDKIEMDLSRVAFEVGQLANQIRLSGAAIASARQYDPKPAKDAITAAIADAQGGPDKPAWFSQGSSVLPTLFAANDQVTKLQADLAQKQDQVKNLTQQRGVLLDQAERATAQVDQLKGDKALEVYKSASDLRRQAGQISVQIDTLQNDIATVQNNLSVAKAQQSAVSDAIVQLKDQIATLDKTWQETDAKAGEHQKLAAEILGSPGTSPAASSAGGSIAEKAVEWDRLAKDVRQLRTDAETRLGNAAKYFDEARKAADELHRDLGEQINDPKNAGRAVMEAWEKAKEAMDPAQFRLQYATAQRALGELHLSEAASAARRTSVVASLQTALEGTSLRVPAELLSGDPNGERNNALKSADAALRESDESLGNIIEGVSDIKGIKDAAKVARALTLYDWAQVASQMGNEKEAKSRLLAATAARNEAAEANAVIPAMPAELGAIPKAAAPGSTDSSSDAGSAVNSSDSPDQAAIRAMLKSFTDALVKGDVDGAKAYMQIDAGQENTANQILQMPVAMMKVEAAMKAKFGEQALQQKDDKGNGMSFSASPTTPDVGKVKINVNGDTATLDEKDDPMSKVIKVNGQWKLHFSAPKSEQESKEMEAMSKIGATMSSLAADIEAGKYAKPEDAASAVMGAFMQAAMGAAGTTTGPATAPQ